MSHSAGINSTRAIFGLLAINISLISLHAESVTLLPPQAAFKAWINADRGTREKVAYVQTESRAIGVKSAAIALFDVETGEKLIERSKPGIIYVVGEGGVSPDKSQMLIVTRSSSDENRRWIEIDRVSDLKVLGKVEMKGSPYIFANDRFVLQTDPANLSFWERRDEDFVQLKDAKIVGAAKISEFAGSDDGRRAWIIAQTFQDVPNVRLKSFKDCADMFGNLPLPSFGAFAEIWDLHRMEPIGNRIGGKVDRSEVWRITPSPDGKILAVEMGDGQRKTRFVALVDVETGNTIAPNLSHENGAVINRIEFNVNGEKLETVAENGEVKTWDAKTGKPLTP